MIDDYLIGELIIDKDYKLCRVLQKTSNSILVYIERKTPMGINCSSWFTIKEFEERFKKYMPKLKGNTPLKSSIGTNCSVG